MHELSVIITYFVEKFVDYETTCWLKVVRLVIIKSSDQLRVILLWIIRVTSLKSFNFKNERMTIVLRF